MAYRIIFCVAMCLQGDCAHSISGSDNLHVGPTNAQITCEKYINLAFGIFEAF